MTSSATNEADLNKFSRYRSINYNLKIVFSCLTAIPFIVFAYIYFRIGSFNSALSGGLVLLALILVLNGFIVFRRMAEQIERLSSSISMSADGKTSIIEHAGDTRELAMIADTFNRTLAKLEDSAHELGVRAVQLSTLNEVRELVSKTIYTEKVAQSALDGAMRAVGSQAGYLAVQRKTTGIIHVVATSGIEGKIPESLEIESEESLAARSIRTSSPVLIEDIDADPDMRKRNRPDLGFPQVLVLPIIVKGASIGVLGLGKEKNAPVFSGEDIQFLQTLLHQVAYSFENARLYETLQQSHVELKKALESRKKAQGYLLASARMTAFGQLSVSIANELNNPLTGILGYAELALQSEPDGELRDNLAQIRDQAVRAGRINKCLLDFATTKEGPRKETNLNEIVNKALSLVRQNILQHGIVLDIKLADDPPSVMVDPVRLQEAFLNLLNNAVQAMTGLYGPPDEGDKIMIIQKKHLTIESGKKDHKAYVCFRDTGTGIKPENLKKIFEPFYSTRNRTTQVGLGLWASQSIVAAHGGSIQVRSKYGKGSLFIIFLPSETKNESLKI